MITDQGWVRRRLTGFGYRDSRRGLRLGMVLEHETQLFVNEPPWIGRPIASLLTRIEAEEEAKVHLRLLEH